MTFNSFSQNISRSIALQMCVCMYLHRLNMIIECICSCSGGALNNYSSHCLSINKKKTSSKTFIGKYMLTTLHFKEQIKLIISSGEVTSFRFRHTYISSLMPKHKLKYIHPMQNVSALTLLAREMDIRRL